MKSPVAGISGTRLIIGSAGILLAAFGVFRLATEIPAQNLLALAVWLGAALVLHDVVLSPAIVGLGVVLRRVPVRARTYLQGALVTGGLVTVVAIPMIYRAGRQPRVKAILDQDYRVNLLVLLGLISTGALLSYLVRIARDHRSTAHGKPAPHRPPGEGAA